MSEQYNKKRYSFLPVLIAGVISASAIALSIQPTFASFVANIQNSINTAGSGYLAMQEKDASGNIICNSTDGGNISINSAVCTTINKYGGNLAMVPGQTVNTNITIQNTGSVTANFFTLSAGNCTQSNNGTPNGSALDICSKYTILIKSGTTTLYSNTASALSGQTINLITAGLSPVTANSTVPITISATLDSAVNNTYQGLKISQPLTWSFAS